MNAIIKALLVSVWFMFLTFPLIVIKVDTLHNTLVFRWENMAYMGVGAFFSPCSGAGAWSARQRSPLFRAVPLHADA